VRIKTSWVALSVVVLSVGLLLVASREDLPFSERQQSAVPEQSVPPGMTVSAGPTAPSLTTPVPSSAPPAPTAAAPSANPAPMPSEQPAPSPAPTAAIPPAPSGTALSTTTPTPPAPPAGAPSAEPSAPPPATPPAAAASEAATEAVPSAPAPATSSAATVAAPAALPPPGLLPPEAEMSAAERRQVQQALHRFDYYKGPIDGIFGPLTRAAIRRFQQDIGSNATGNLSADQANRLVMPR
jgi:hypothetical protein